MYELVHPRGTLARTKARRAGSQAFSDKILFFMIQISEQPEGVWLATSNDIPGLIVEGDTEEEARNEAMLWAIELLADNVGYDPATRAVLIFDDGRARVYARA